MTERQITDRLLKLINNSGPNSFALKYYGSAMTRTGVPDLIGAWYGKPFSVEVKKPDETGNTTLAQKAWMRRFSRGGYVVGVVTSIHDFYQLLEPLDIHSN